MPNAKSTSRPRLCIHKNQSVIALFNEIQASDSPVLRIKNCDFAVILRHISSVNEEVEQNSGSEDYQH